MKAVTAAAALCCAIGGTAMGQDAKQILTMTKPGWVAVREYDGKDLLYFTNLLAWRCGVDRIRFSVNGASLAPLKHEPCHEDDPAPNSLYAEDILPYLEYPLGSVETISVEVSFPDGSKETGNYDRASVAMR